MSFTKLRKLFLAFLACATATELAVVSTALGQTFVWARGSGLYSEPFNWMPVTGAPPNSPDATAQFGTIFGSNGPTTVTLTGGPFTVGKLVFGKLGSPFTFQNGTLRVATEIDTLERGKAANFASNAAVVFLGRAMTINTAPLSVLTFAGTVGESTDGNAVVAPGANGVPKGVWVEPNVPVAAVPGPAGCTPSRISRMPALPTAVVIASMRAFSSAAE